MSNKLQTPPRVDTPNTNPQPNGPGVMSKKDVPSETPLPQPNLSGLTDWELALRDNEVGTLVQDRDSKWSIDKPDAKFVAVGYPFVSYIKPQIAGQTGS